MLRSSSTATCSPNADFDRLVQGAGQIAAAEHRAVSRLKGHLAVGEHSGVGDVDFITDMRLGVIRIREHVTTLRASIPAVLGIGQVQVRVPQFDMVTSAWTGL